MATDSAPRTTPRRSRAASRKPRAGGRGPRALDDDVNWLMHRVAYGLGMTIQTRLLEHGVGIRAHIVLSAIAERPGRVQSALGQRVGLDKSTLTGVLDDLERRELIVRRPSAEDRRARIPALTSEGERLLARTAEVAAAAEADGLRALTAAQRRELHGLLRQLADAPVVRDAAPGGSCL